MAPHSQFLKVMSQGSALTMCLANLSLIFNFLRGHRRYNMIQKTLLKGNEALEKNFFFSSPRQGNMERKSKLKKKIKISLFPASQTTFWKCRK